MKLRNIKFIITSVAVLGMTACTKLDQRLQSTFTTNPAGSNPDVVALLNGAYNDASGLLHGQDQIFSLEENTADECLVPTRGGDWDDNGVWRVLHSHNWQVTHGQTTSVFSGLGQLESDAISTLAFNPNPQQKAEAYFLRSVAQFYLLDLYGQVPYRTIADYNAITAAPVLGPEAAIDTLIATLTSIIPSLPANTSNATAGRANQDAARFLLMKVYLNKGAWLHRSAPTFDPADMAQVIALGTTIQANGYSLTPNYFDNFGPHNASLGKEAIWAWPNNGTASNNGINGGGINARWMMTLHYNSWDQQNTYGGAGWNGFSTVASFYNTFEGSGNSTIDTTKDSRLGGRFYPGVTDQSGLRPGLLVGLQKNEAGVGEVDRHGNPLAFTPDVALVETDANTLEVAGIRIVKYGPDYANYSGGHQNNQLQIFRYADVLLMMAEAYLRTTDAGGTGPSLTLVNQIRQARGASTLASISLVNASNTYDPGTLLAERGRELYWESWRRQDLIRFGVYLIPWDLKTSDDPKNLLFPIPQAQIIANPNLKQNPGY